MPEPQDIWCANQVVIGRATNHKSPWTDRWAWWLTEQYQSMGTRVFWKNNIKASGPRDLCWKLGDPEAKINKEALKA